MAVLLGTRQIRWFLGFAIALLVGGSSPRLSMSFDQPLPPDLSLAMPVPPEFGEGSWTLFSAHPIDHHVQFTYPIWLDSGAPEPVDAVLESGFVSGFVQTYFQPSAAMGGVDGAPSIEFMIVNMNGAEAANGLYDAVWSDLGSSTREPESNRLEMFIDGQTMSGMQVHDTSLLMVRYMPDAEIDASFFSDGYDDASVRIEEGMSALQRGLERAGDAAVAGNPGPGQQILTTYSPFEDDGVIRYPLFDSQLGILNIRARDSHIVSYVQDSSRSPEGLITEVVNRQSTASDENRESSWFEIRVLTFGSADDATVFAGNSGVLPIDPLLGIEIELTSDPVGPHHAQNVRYMIGDEVFGTGLRKVYVEDNQVVVVTALTQSPADQASPETVLPGIQETVDLLAADQVACLQMPTAPCDMQPEERYFR